MARAKPLTPTAPKGAPPPSRGRARYLHKNATDAEKRLWYDLRDFKRGGHYFRRQVPIGPYIVDFACHKAKLIVELDGGHHTEDEQRVHDLKRDAWLENQGYRVLRFWNANFYKNRRDVLDAIYSALPLEGGGGRSVAEVGGGAPQRSGGKQK